jgi:hypothetical protein
MAAKAGPYDTFSDAVQSSIDLYRSAIERSSKGRIVEEESGGLSHFNAPTSAVTTLMLFIEPLLSVIDARLISLLKTSVARSMLAAVMDCTDEKGIPTRASVAGRQTMMVFVPLSLGPARKRGSRHWITRSGVICVAVRYRIYVSLRDTCSKGAGLTEI